MVKRVLLLFSLLISIAISACKCNPPTIEGSFESADFVFIGDVYDVNKTYKTGYWEVENSLARIKIDKIYKSLGNDFRSKEITFFGQQFNSCDIILDEKGKYLIFAYIDPDTTFFYSSFCLATQEVSKLNDRDFTLLKKLNKEFTEKSLKQNSGEETFHLLMKTPDRIINELKFKNQQLSEDLDQYKTNLTFVSVLLFLTALIVVVVYRRNNSGNQG